MFWRENCVSSHLVNYREREARFVCRKTFKQVFSERENHPQPYPHIHTHSQKTLIKAGYNHKWPYQKHYQKKYSSQKSAKSILPHNKLHKLLNKSNTKIRYSWLSNIKSITNASSRKIPHPSRTIGSRTWNCINIPYPLQQNCLSSNILHQANIYSIGKKPKFTTVFVKQHLN